MSNVFLILVLLSILGLIVGLIKPSIVIRWGDPEKRNRKTVLKTYITAFIVFFFAFGFTVDSAKESAKPQAPDTKTVQTSSAKEDNKKKQQEAFLSWYDGLNVQIKNFDKTSAVWKNTLDDLGNEKINRYQAYSQLKPVQDNMKNLSLVFGKMEPPVVLSKEHQKLLQDATQDFSTMSYCRQTATEKTLKFIDDMKPSSMQGANEDVESANKFMIAGIAKITQVRSELDLLEQATSK